DIAEGRLVAVRLGSGDVLYQVTAAQIAQRQEVGMTRDIVQIRARKLGVWNPEETVFNPVPWIPVAGEEVTLMNEDAITCIPDEIGQVPGTTYGIKLDIDLAVTHNTAILGILGVGKTHLAWELVSRMLVKGIKVVVLDITGQYSEHFQDIFSPEDEARVAA